MDTQIPEAKQKTIQETQYKVHVPVIERKVLYSLIAVMLLSGIVAFGLDRFILNKSNDLKVEDSTANSFLVSPTRIIPNESKTYKHITLGFEFQYPEPYEITEGIGPDLGKYVKSDNNFILIYDYKTNYWDQECVSGTPSENARLAINDLNFVRVKLCSDSRYLYTFESFINGRGVPFMLIDKDHEILNTFRFSEELKFEIKNDPQLAGWQQLIDHQNNYKISYPLKVLEYSKYEWGYKKSGLEMVFGLKDILDSVGMWKVNLYSKEDTSKELIISSHGGNFLDRKEVRRDIKINGIPAVLATITATQFSNDDWVSSIVVLENNDYYFVIGHEEQYKVPGFEKFYNSFEFID